MFIYAMSDIHGEKEAFEDALSVVDFSRPDTVLVLCGDYFDSRHEHPEFLTYMREFQESHEGQVVALMGNHEAWLLEHDTPADDPVFLDDMEEALYVDEKEEPLLRDEKTRRWLSRLPLYYETDSQIFVHAGIDEDAGEYWKLGVEDWYFYGKYPPTYGTAFEKDIVAGHVGTYQMCGEHRVFWDGKSHFFIDGTTEESKFVPVLKYDTETEAYTSFKKVGVGTEAPQWLEYAVTPEPRL